MLHCTAVHLALLANVFAYATGCIGRSEYRGCRCFIQNSSTNALIVAGILSRLLSGRKIEISTCRNSGIAHWRPPDGLRSFVLHLPHYVDCGLAHLRGLLCQRLCLLSCRSDVFHFRCVTMYFFSDLCQGLCGLLAVDFASTCMTFRLSRMVDRSGTFRTFARSEIMPLKTNLTRFGEIGWFCEPSMQASASRRYFVSFVACSRCTDGQVTS